MATDLGVKVTEEGKYYFISYNTEDAEIVSHYLKMMTSRGLPVWYDYGIPQGEYWKEVIAEKIYNCEAMIMFLSSKLFKKENSFVKKEWNIAKGRPKKVYIVILDKIDENNIPPRYAFWWSDIKETQSIQAYKMDINKCADKILEELGYISKETSPNLTNESSDDEFEIKGGVLIKYNGNASIIKIPESVTSIGDNAFLGCEMLKDVIMSDKVTIIGNSAFADCKRLESISISKQMLTIGDSVFSGCSNLVSITIPDSIINIGGAVFYKCSNLETIRIPKQVSKLDNFLFYECKRLKVVEICGNVTSIGCDTFYGCTSLETLEIPDSVNSIGDFAFFKCISLTSIRIPDNVISIGAATFSGCNKLSYVTLGDSVMNIGVGAFENCTNITSITIPGSLTQVSESMFANCSNLSSIVIPICVTSIDDKAFKNCKCLKTIKYLSSKEDWANISFGRNWDQDTGRYTIHTTDDDFIVEFGTLKLYKGNFSVIKIPNEVISIGDSAFRSCKSLVSVTIPKSVTSIDNNAFAYCTNLTTIIYLGTREQWEKIKFGENWNNRTPKDMQIVFANSF